MSWAAQNIAPSRDRRGQPLLRRGFIWVAVYLVLLVLPLVVAAVGERPPARAFWVEFSVALGFVGLAMMVLQFVVSARIRTFTAPFGIDVVLQYHRQIGLVAIVFVLVHPLILAAERSWSLLNPLEAGWPQAAGMLAIAGLLVQAGVTLWRAQLRIPYGYWHLSHAAIAVAILAFSYAHIVLAGPYLDTTWKAWLWAAMAGAVIVLVIYARVIKPVRMLRYPYRVAAVHEERGKSWTLELEPEGHERLHFRPGQFAWLTLGRNPFLSEEHPFSLASPPRDESGTLHFTIKEAGDFTTRVKDTPVGTRAYIDGPYGAFTFERFPAPGYVFLAGGIGITPIMSMLRSLAADGDQRPLLLFNANPTWEDVTYREEFDELQQQLNLQVVHILEKPPEDWQGESGFVNADILDRHLPGNRQVYQYFICGPPPMLEAVREGLLDLGIPLSQIQIEEFVLA